MTYHEVDSYINKVVVCHPRFYELKPLKQNTYTKRDRGVNRNLATQQWIRLIRILTTNGIHVERVEPQKKIPQMVFSSQIGVIIDNYVFLAKHLEDIKELEVLAYLKYFNNRAYKFINMPYFFSGQADMLFSHNKRNLWIGYDQRTSLKAANYLVNLLACDNLSVRPLCLVSHRFYHLDLCFCPFGDRYALVYPDAFTKSSYGLILSIFGKENIIPVNQIEANSLVCNSLFIRDISGITKGYLLGHKFSVRLKNIISRLTYKCIELPISEFIVGGGSVRSLILEA